MTRVKSEFRIKVEERIKYLLENEFETLKDDEQLSKLLMKLVLSYEELEILKGWFLNKNIDIKEREVSKIITKLKPIVYDDRNIEKMLKSNNKMTIRTSILKEIYERDILIF